MTTKKASAPKKRGRPRKIEMTAEMPTVEQFKREAIAGYKPQPDPVNHPAHYTQGGIECIDALAAATVGLTGIEAVCTSNAIKYLWRWKTKGGLQDLQKAQWYLTRLLTEAAKAPVKGKKA